MRILTFVAAGLIFAGLAPVYAQSQLAASQIPPQQTATVQVPVQAPTLAAGTAVVVALDSTIKSNGTGEGDPVALHVVDNVTSTDPSHTLFLAKGAPAMGHVIVSSKRGYVGRRGDLQFQIDYVIDVAGERVYLSDSCIGGRGTDRGAIAVAGALFVTSAALLTQGGDKKFASGTQFTVYVDQSAVLAGPAEAGVSGPTAAPAAR